MQVYLPIAEMSVDALLLLGIGFGVGWLSGLFGVGGGFLLTPLLILIGIPSPVAVASGANQTLGASVSGLIAQWRRDNVDVRMGCVLLAGGLLGSFAGVAIERVPKGEPVTGRSHCVCGALVQARDNVPVLSYVLRRGRARCCGARIPAWYFAIELLGAVLAVGLYTLVI